MNLIPRPLLKNQEKGLVTYAKNVCSMSEVWVDESCSSITNYYILDHMKVVALFQDQLKMETRLADFSNFRNSEHIYT